MRKRLERPQDDRIIAGVCAGLANYFNLEPLFVRVLFILLFPIVGGVILYMALWITMPEASGSSIGVDADVDFTR